MVTTQINLILLKKYRFELSSKNKYYLHGFIESMSIDNCIHSFFGASKLSADLYVQEFGKYFGLNTVTFRGGCLTGRIIQALNFTAFYHI